MIFFLTTLLFFRLFKKITKENRSHFEKVLELDCLGVGTVKVFLL